MEKEALLSNINETRDTVRRLQGVHHQLESLHTYPFKFLAVIAHIIGFSAYTYIVSYSLAYLTLIITYPINWVISEKVYDGILTFLVVIVFIGVAISYPYVFNFLNRKRFKKNEEIRNKKDQELQEEKQIILKQLGVNSVIPEDYRFVFALNLFEKYLINQRTDNLKECINLFEQEKRHEEQIDEMKIMQKMQEDTYQKANEAATLGWINLFRR